MPSSPKDISEGDPIDNANMQGGLRSWYNRHPELKSGNKLRFETLKCGKKYKLSIIHR